MLLRLRAKADECPSAAKEGMKLGFGDRWSTRSIYSFCCSEHRSVVFVVLLGEKALISAEKQPSSAQGLEQRGRKV